MRYYIVMLISIIFNAGLLDMALSSVFPYPVRIALAAIPAICLMLVFAEIVSYHASK